MHVPTNCPHNFPVRKNALARLLRILIGIAIASHILSIEPSAAIRRWIGNNGPGGANNWTNTGNWTGNVAPTSADTALFNDSCVSGPGYNTNGVAAAIIIQSNFAYTVALTGTFSLTLSGTGSDFRGGFSTANTNKIIFNGSGSQTFIPHATANMGVLVSNGSGSVTPQTNAFIADTLRMESGTFNLGSGFTHTVNGTLNLKAGTLDFGSSTLAFAGATAAVSGLTTLTASTGTLRFSAASGTQVFTPKVSATHPNITHTGAGTLQLATNDLSCLSFSNSAGVLDFNSRNITTVSSGNFTVTNGTTTTFTNLAGRTLTVDGNASLTGQNGNLLNLNPGSAWTLTATASSSVTATYATIGNGTVNPSNITGSTSNCTDGGSNTRWAFLTTATWDGGGGDYNWSTAANWNPNSVPGSSSQVVFDNTSTKKCVLDAGATVYSIQFTSGYTSSDANTGNFNFGTQTLIVATGNVDFTMGSGASITAGSGTLSFTATSGTQTFTPRSGSTFPAVTKSGAGSVLVATSALSAGAFTLSGGSWDWGASTLTHAVTSLSTSGSSTLIFGTNTVQVTTGNADLSGLSTLTANTGTLAFTAGSGTQVLTPKASTTHPAISHTGAGTLQLSTNTLACRSFSQSAGVLDFNGRDITTVSAGNFTVTNGTSSSFTGLAGRTLTVDGNASLSGQNGNLLNLNPGSAWTLTATASSTVLADFANVSYGTVNPSNIAGMATNSTNGGNNTRWTFINTRTWDGGGSDGTCGGGAGDGNKWSCAANWSADTAPASGDTTVFNGTSTKNCKLDASITVRAISFASAYTGTFDFQTYTLSVDRTVDLRTGGAVTPGTGKISFTGTTTQILIPPPQQANSILPSIEQNGTGGTTVTLNRLRTSALILANLASNGAFNLGSGLTDTVTTTLTLNANGSLHFGSSTLVFEGSAADFSNLSTLTPGSGTLSFPGGVGNNVTFTPKTSGTFPAITKQNANTVTVATNSLTAGALSVGGGTWSWGSSSLTHAVASITITNSATMTFNSNTVQVATGNCDFASSTLNANSGTLVFTASSGTQVFTPNSGTTHPIVSHTGAGTLQLSTNDLTAKGFNQSAGVLDFNGRNIIVNNSGNLAFTNIGTTGLTNLGGRTLTVAGNASLSGTSSVMATLNPGSTWTLNVTGTLTASFATLGNSNASGSTSAGQADNCENMGSNTNWTFLINLFSSWRHSTKVAFNTTSAGANVSGNVSSFPLLVRLDSNNFLFNQAHPSGNDIRFSDADGTTLSYSIERWSSSLRKAEVWVKVPQIDGNSDRDYINMYWGNPNATSMASNSGVWGGYVGVWNLGESPGASAPQFTDASGNNNNATAQGGVAGDSAGSNIGMGYKLNGSSKYISTTTSFYDIDILTTQCWFKATTLVGGLMVGWQGNQTGAGGQHDRKFYMGNDGKINFGIYSGGHFVVTSASSFNDGRWHHVAGRIDANGIALYVDGVLAGSNAQGNPEATTAYWRAGYGDMGGWPNAPTSEYFNGTLDQVAVTHTSLSADFIKLAYETQKRNTTAVSYPNMALSTFSYSTRAYVNTSHTGAATNSDATNFPMVVRLTAGNFDFSQAKSDGGDIRFADSSGALLSYEIERFDAASKKAEIWVLLPSVKGNNNAQWFRMHWGKATASSLSSSTSVFSSANAFYGVWHLGEDGNTTGGGYRDASSFGNNGTGTGLTSSSDVAGAVGMAQTFNGTTSCINAGGGATGSNLHFNTNFTWEGWANTTAKGASDKIISKAYSASDLTPYTQYDLAVSGTNTGWTSGVTTGGTSAWSDGTTTIANSTWYHVVSVYDGANLRIYVNGVLEKATAKSGTVNDYARSVNIGCYEATSTNHISGILDEVRIQGAARSADWIKLSYESQKSGSAVVSLGARSPEYTASVRFTFNTKASGANVAGNVTDIPILVRFTSSNLDFSRTQSAGSDLQFVDRDGTYLYHEVIDWDKANKTGKAWVRVPQVNGNDSTDFITLYYGCSLCTGTPYASADSVWSGYRGSWNMNVTNENQARDASPFDNHLSYTNDVPSATGLTAPLAPYINNNYAKVADPSGGDLDMGSGDFTLAGWVKTTLVPGVGAWPVIFGKTNPSVTPRYGIGVVMNEGGVNAGKFFVEIFSNGTQKATGFSTTLINDGNWHHIVARRSGGTLSSWCDGVSQGTVASAGLSVDNPEPFTVGGVGDENASNAWTGYINGINIAAAAFSDDFIKLSYMNQKATDALLSTPITFSTSSFQYSKAYKFNTTSNGVAISGDIYNFPLLIRLTGTTVIDGVQANAPDIRFLDGDGVTWLDYSIERWNQTSDSAEVWVKVPKVDGNSNADFITLYYGQAAGVIVPDGQCAACVFDGNNVKAVWHMNDNAASGTVTEARGSYNGALRLNNTSRNTNQVDTAGYIGQGSLFLSTTADNVFIGEPSDLLQNAAGVTMSAWVRPTTLGTNTRHVFFASTNASGTTRRANLSVSSTSYLLGGGRSSDAQSEYALTATSSLLSTGNWYHLAVVNDFKGDSTRMYVNGARVTPLNAAAWAQGKTDNTTSNSVRIGRQGNTSAELFVGFVDEMQVSARSHDSNWVKLSYQTQRRDATLLFNPSPADFVSTRKYVFNTTRTGANVMGDVSNFPLLVRITGSAIVDAVQNDWDDIRFLDSDGKTWLQYQVERWDKDADEADVWVLVPKVDGNSDQDFITLYYDDAANSAVTNGQCANCVFSSSGGYAGVWHLGENPNGDAASVIRDQTANAYHGTPTGSMTTADSVAGVIGGALDFDGSNDGVLLADIDKGAGNVLSASAWYKTSASIQPGTGNEGYLFTKDRYGSANPYGAYLNSSNLPKLAMNNTVTSGGVASNDGVWHQIFLTYDGTTMKKYADGQFTSSVAATNLENNEKVAIGTSEDTPTYRPFQGVIDEVVISQAVRDSNWIRLCYQSQRQASGNRFWNSRPGPNNKSVLTATANTTSISLAWTGTVSDSANADSVGIWVKYSGPPDSAGASGQTKVVVLPKTDSVYTYPAVYPSTYYFALAVRNASGQWSPFTAASTDTATLSFNFAMNDTVYVDSAIGSNANSCAASRNPATPRQTLDSAMACGAIAVDTLVVRVMPGRYTTTYLVVTGSKPTVVTSFDLNSRAVLNGSGSVTEGSARNYTVSLDDYVTLRNMDVMAATNGYLGVYLRSGADYAAIDGCRIYNRDASTKHAEGIYAWDDGVDELLIANNIIYQPTTYGIHADQNNHFNIINNVMVGPGSGGSKGFYFDESSSDETTITITNNIFYNWDYGIHTLDANSEIGKVENNNFHLVTNGREVVGEADPYKVVKDPLFYSTTIGDRNAFKLMPGSPAIDAGTSGINSGSWSVAQYLAKDFFGSTRTQGAAREIGAYEGTGYTPNPAVEFDSLTNTVSGNTVIVKNSKWKLLWDMARGGGITGFYDMTGDTTVNLVASGSLLFDVRIDSHLASLKTGNTFAPHFLERTRARSVVRQRLALSASLDLDVTYTVHPSGHVYVQSGIVNLSSGALAVGAVEYLLKVGTATAVTRSGSNLAGISYKNGFGYLTTATKDPFLAAIRDLDGSGNFSETWSQAGSIAGSLDSVGFATADLADPAQNMYRYHNFLLYVGDNTLDLGKASTLNADAYTPSVVSTSSGSLLHERSWQDRLGGHWTFDEGAGTAALDKSINFTNSATLTSAPWVSGKVGGALRFTTASVGAVATHTALDASQNRTYMLWVKPDFSSMGADAFLLSKGTGISNGWHFRRVSAQNKVKFVMANVEVQSPDLTNGAWVHLAASVDGSRIVRLFVNGVLVGASTTAATVATNTDGLRMGENTGGGTADRFAGDLDDVRIYHYGPSVAEIQALVNRGFSPQHGHYHLRADNNNRVVALLNESGAATRVQPSFRIDNWFGISKTPKYVYLNGIRLVPNVDFVVDSIRNFSNTWDFGNSLLLQVNKVLTGSSQTLFVDDNDSSGYLGTAGKMKSLTMSSIANDKLTIRNFADTVFGSATSGQWHLELDLNGWDNAANSRVTDTGFGEFNAWKAAAVSPNVAIGSATQLVGKHSQAGQSLASMKFRTTTSDIYSAGLGYGSFTNISYTLVDSSAARLSLTLPSMTVSGTGASITLAKRWTVYPTGRIFGSFQVASTDIAMTDVQVRLNARYNTSPTTCWGTSYAMANARWGIMGGDLNMHSLADAILSVKSNGAVRTSPTLLMKTPVTGSDNASGADIFLAQLKMVDSLMEATDDPITVNFVVDISRDFTDSASADSLMADLQTPATITAINGSTVSNDALDFNGDGFAEGDGAYVYTASGSGIAHFKYANTVTHFNPAFRIKSWSYSTVPEFVILDNQTLTSGYHYNAYVNTATSELILQLNRTLSPFTHALYLAHKTGLAVTLDKFEAVGGEGLDSLIWSTQSELENLGFNVYRRPLAVAGGAALEEMDPAAGAGIANALAAQARSEAAKRAASEVDSLATHAWSSADLKAQGWQRLNAKTLPGAPGGSSSTTRDYVFLDRTAAFGTIYEYLLEAVDFSGEKVQYGPRRATPGNPLETALLPNYPNPFNPITTLRFTLRDKAKVSLRIYDSKGRLVRTLITPRKAMAPGKYRLLWDARDEGGFEVPSGHYYYRLTVPGYAKSRKMILLK